jgi:hypothetical protein
MATAFGTGIIAATVGIGDNALSDTYGLADPLVLVPLAAACFWAGRSSKSAAATAAFALVAPATTSISLGMYFAFWPALDPGETRAEWVGLGMMVCGIFGAIPVAVCEGAAGLGYYFSPGRRERLRVRLGHCTRCNYDLSGLPPGTPCPECAARPQP